MDADRTLTSSLELLPLFLGGARTTVDRLQSKRIVAFSRAKATQSQRKHRLWRGSTPRRLDEQQLFQFWSVDLDRRPTHRPRWIVRRDPFRERQNCHRAAGRHPRSFSTKTLHIDFFLL